MGGIKPGIGAALAVRSLIGQRSAKASCPDAPSDASYAWIPPAYSLISNLRPPPHIGPRAAYPTAIGLIIHQEHVQSALIDAICFGLGLDTSPSPGREALTSPDDKRPLLDFGPSEASANVNIFQSSTLSEPDRPAARRHRIDCSNTVKTRQRSLPISPFAAGSGQHSKEAASYRHNAGISQLASTLHVKIVSTTTTGGSCSHGYNSI